ncbi:MAG: nicotinate (nicotinamide) nucleotide adenylyltransferase [Oscillospiraceae bacterium]|nr:nicotinate (nicotinamide) nucleotide adenylyltransferase [Oscillospiraceae bacterium]
MKTGILGGSFDPIHNGHLALAGEFTRRLSLDRLLLIPTLAPPHKSRPDMADAGHRLAMCRLAAERLERVTVSDIEIRRGSVSYTIKTLEQLREEYPDDELFLIVGADMFLSFKSWYRYRDILKMAVICAAPRQVEESEIKDQHSEFKAGYRTTLEKFASILKRDGGRCRIEDIPLTRVSSTEIRERYMNGETSGGLLPAEVDAYIRQNRLYGSFPLSDQPYIDAVRARNRPHRFFHSLCVAREAERLAAKYRANPEKARIAGLLHDITKDQSAELSAEKQLQLIQKFDILNDSDLTIYQTQSKLLHAPVGAACARQLFGITDPEILLPIRYHTTARAGMSLQEKILYLADFTSADRDYPDVDEMRRRTEISISGAMEYALAYTINELNEKNMTIHPDTLAAYAEVIK